ncbi:MAG: hypothetical protein RJA81_2178 [Planctomycetota bacterium]|jgi:hypothetical protein
MNRIFLSLAATNFSLLIASYVLGIISVSQWPGRHDQALGVHFLIALATVMFSLLVHSIVYTYFLGTNRWVREVVEIYKMPGDVLARSKSLKRKAFKWEFRAMTVVAIAAWLGAWVHREYPVHVQQQSLYHHLAAVVVILISLTAFSIEYKLIELQGKLLNEVKDLADRMRQERIDARTTPESTGLESA